MKQRITIVNTNEGTKAALLLERQTCRLSLRQAREGFRKLSKPGADDIGELGEFPLDQVPPECGGETYRVIKVGRPTSKLSNLYFVPISAIPALMKSVGNGA